MVKVSLDTLTMPPPAKPLAEFSTTAIFTASILQLPHLANGVYTAVRTGWRHQVTYPSPTKPTKHRVISGARFPAATSSAITNHSAALALAEPLTHVGLLHPCAILVDKDIYDQVRSQVRMEQRVAWHSVLHNSRCRKLWYFRTKPRTWHPNPSVPVSAADFFLRLAKELAAQGLIQQCSAQQHEWLLRERANET